VLDKLREDHQLGSGILHRLRELVEGLDGSAWTGERPAFLRTGPVE
jgi:hypothetical protein